MRPLLKYVDDFHADPDRLRAAALAADYFVPEGIYGLRTTKAFFDPRTLARKLRASFGFTRIRFSHSDEGSGRIYQSLGAGKRREPFFAHYDDAFHPRLPRYALIVYLTPGAPLESGTGLFRHRPTGLWKLPTAEDGLRLKSTRQGLIDRLLADAFDPALWELLDRCGNVFNRAVLLPSHWYHSGLGYFGDRLENGRIYQAFFFKATPYIFEEPPEAEP